MTKTPDPVQPRPSTTRPAAAIDAGRSQQRQQLRLAKCARRGLRFLPEQVMRPLYERAGLL